MAEQRARDVAAVLGVADFVYAQPLVRKGSATREVGDGLLICGGRGAVLQVKARDRDAGRGDSPEKAARVVGKFLEAAVRQGRGTKRTIAQHVLQGQPLRVIPVRALDYPSERREEFALALTEDCADWPIVVIIDHPNDPVVKINPDADVFCISLDDWHELNAHVRSVNGVLRYIERVLGHGAALAVPFGEERRRFAKLVEADAASTAGSTTAVPWLSYDGVDDPVAVAMYRDLLEKVWGGQARGPALTADECRRILDALDDVPVATQTRVGRWVLDKRRTLRQTGQRASGPAAASRWAMMISIAFSSTYATQKLTRRAASIGRLSSAHSRWSGLRNGGTSVPGMSELSASEFGRPTGASNTHTSTPTNPSPCLMRFAG